MDDVKLIRALLNELRYVHSTGNIRDSERNSGELQRLAAVRLGFADFADYCAGVDEKDSYAAT